MEILQVLNAKEQEQLLNAIPLITVLVAGADGKIDAIEMEKAEKISEIRSYSHHAELRSFYEKAHQNLGANLKDLVESLPDDLQERQEAISEELSQLNPILRKLNTHTGHILYESFLSFAEHVAKASGGVIGIFTINTEEKKVIKLSMIKPILE